MDRNMIEIAFSCDCQGESADPVEWTALGLDDGMPWNPEDSVCEMCGMCAAPGVVIAEPQHVGS